MELRVPAREDFAGFFGPVFRAFGTPEPTAEELDDEQVLWEPERSVGALVDGDWVGTAGAYSFELTVPGGGLVPAAGVTMVGVDPAHRRRGVLSALMARQLDDVAAGSEPLAVLTASESVIYGRFGYGLATTQHSIEIGTDPRRSAFRDPPAAEGRVRLVRFADGYDRLQAAFDCCRRLRPGMLARSPAYWELLSRDRTSWRDGASALFLAVHEDGCGHPDGYATWRIDQSWRDGLPAGRVKVELLDGVDAEVEASLWRFLLDLDLVTALAARERPVDDPLRWRLAEPRRLKVTSARDHLWLRVVDVPAALEARTWSAPGRLVLDVDDRFRPAWGGCFALAVGDDGRASVERASGPAELTLAADDLGAVYLGGVAPSTLAAAGRVRAEGHAALTLADRMFASPRAPFCNTGF
ncbi:MAG: GNAT family N-acetyltransferase [Actinobacteria bacterium]|nr:GNAT family N-acetyltransferase [Actinomycetota bacterium]